MASAEQHLIQFDPAQFFEIRINSVITGMPLPFDIYLVVNAKPTLFRKIGETLTPERLKLLVLHGGEKFLVPEGQKQLYLNSLKNAIKDPGSSQETKSRIIKEAAFLHVHDLFTKKDISSVVVEAKNLVEEMVNFVTSDVEAAASLMRLSVHDYYTYNHSVDVAVYAIALAKKVVGDNHEMLIMAGLGGLLHDIGKRQVPLEIINKNGGLNKSEWEEIKKHPEYGGKIVEDNYIVPDASKLVVLEHHENFDGTGYPLGLKGDEISLLARVVSIADVFDALTTKRSYHDAVLAKEALGIMYGMQPGKFDPEIFQSFDKKFSPKSPIALPETFDPCDTKQSRIKLKLVKK